VYGKSQHEVGRKLRALQRTVSPAPANLTVARFLRDWLDRFLLER
jgi:hypothetical protein